MIMHCVIERFTVLIHMQFEVSSSNNFRICPIYSEVVP
jgi:hypothetical protein